MRNRVAGSNTHHSVHVCVSHRSRGRSRCYDQNRAPRRVKKWAAMRYLGRQAWPVPLPAAMHTRKRGSPAAQSASRKTLPAGMRTPVKGQDKRSTWLQHRPAPGARPKNAGIGEAIQSLACGCVRRTVRVWFLKVFVRKTHMAGCVHGDPDRSMEGRHGRRSREDPGFASLCPLQRSLELPGYSSEHASRSACKWTRQAWSLVSAVSRMHRASCGFEAV